MLVPLLHLQHHGRHVQQAQLELPAGFCRLPAHHVAGLHEQLRQSGHLHDIQPGIPEGLQEAHVSGTLKSFPGETLELLELFLLHCKTDRSNGTVAMTSDDQNEFIANISLNIVIFTAGLNAVIKNLLHGRFFY